MTFGPQDPGVYTRTGGGASSKGADAGERSTMQGEIRYRVVGGKEPGTARVELEIGYALKGALAQFGRPGLVLHCDIEVKKRKELVLTFQEDESVPFFILSLKAGGAGLTLTAAAHVVHFDRWWNPAVENQATDRAYRIGQKKNVLVHKFVCQGTVEEKIDALIESKKTLAEDLLAGSGAGEINMTEMRDDELMRLVALDLNTAMVD